MIPTPNVGLIGTKVMGRADSNAWLNMANYFDAPVTPVVRSVVGRHADDLEEFAARLGWGSTTTDYRTMLSYSGVDLVDAPTPNDVHVEQAIAAIEAVKPPTSSRCSVAELEWSSCPISLTSSRPNAGSMPQSNPPETMLRSMPEPTERNQTS